VDCVIISVYRTLTYTVGHRVTTVHLGVRGREGSRGWWGQIESETMHLDISVLGLGLSRFSTAKPWHLSDRLKGFATAVIPT
jgi:hypothetical protein